MFSVTFQCAESLTSKPYQYFWFNYLQPNQDWWQGYLSAGRNHDTPPSFRLPCLNILKSPSQASKSSKKGHQSPLHCCRPRMVAGASPGYHWRRIPSPACAASLHNGPQCPCARSRLAYTPNIYTVFCNKSFIFFNLKLLPAPCSADTPSIYTIICNQLLNWSFYRTRVQSLATPLSLTNLLTKYNLLSRLDWWDPGMWRCHTKLVEVVTVADVEA